MKKSLRGHEVPEAISVRRLLRPCHRPRRCQGRLKDSLLVLTPLSILASGLRRPAGLLAMTVAVLLPGLSFSGCGSGATETAAKKPALVVNKLKLTSEEIKQERVVSAWAHDAEPAKGEEPEWLGRVIERELLVQEAQRLGIDREPEFMRTIERFWKEALIKILLNRKSREITAMTHVYEPEIEAEYQKLVEEGAGQPVEPLSELHDQIAREIQQRKESEALDAWVLGLRTQAKIEVDQEAIQSIE